MLSFVGGLVWRHILNAERKQWLFVKVPKSRAWVPHFSLCRVFRNMFQIICSGVLQECYHPCWRTLLVVRNGCVMLLFVGGLFWRRILNAERNQWLFVKLLKSGAWVPHLSLCRVFRNMFQILCSGVLQECSITSAGEHYLLSGSGCVMFFCVDGLVWRRILNAERNQGLFAKGLKSGAWVPHFSLCRVFGNMFQISCSGVLQECSISSAGEHFLLSGMDV